MALTIYKSGQGYWTRMLSAIGAGMILAVILAWLWQEMTVISDPRTQTIARVVTAVLLVGGLGSVIFWIMNKPNIVDFFIATDAEMRKVNWPTRREIIGATWVVICGTLLMALLLWIVDLGFIFLFQRIGIIVGSD